VSVARQSTFVRLGVIRLAVFRIEISAKDKNARQTHHKERDAEPQPDVSPEDWQIKHGTKYGTVKGQKPGDRTDCHFDHNGTVFFHI
jgi:hypothetical protein